MNKLRLFIVIIIAATSALAQGSRGRQSQAKDAFRLNHSLPYVYLEVDHIGLRVPYGNDEPNVGVFLRLHNNCTVSISVDTFVGIDNNVNVFHNVVVNPIGLGEPAASELVDISALTAGIKMDPSLLFGNSATKAQSPAPLPVQSVVPAPPMPVGYRALYSSPKTLGPGQSIYFSIPLNHVSDKWHVEVPFHLELRDRSTKRSPYNFVALYEEDINLPATNRHGSIESDAPKPTSTGNTILHEPDHLEETPAH